MLMTLQIMSDCVTSWSSSGRSVGVVVGSESKGDISFNNKNEICKAPTLRLKALMTSLLTSGPEVKMMTLQFTSGLTTLLRRACGCGG